MMKSNHADVSKTRRLLMYLDGTLSENEKAMIKEELEESAELRAALDDISKVLYASRVRPELRLRDEEVDKIFRTITGRGAFSTWQKGRSYKYWGIGLAAAAALLIGFLRIEAPSRDEALDWEATEFQALFAEIEVVSTLLSESEWLDLLEPRDARLQNADDALADARFRFLELASALSDTLLNSTIERRP